MGILDRDIPGRALPDSELQALQQIREQRNESAQLQAGREYRSLLIERTGEGEEEAEQ